MSSVILNYFGMQQENNYHRPILYYINDNLNHKIFKKIISRTNFDIFIKTTYSFYDSNNYLIFKLHISNILDDYTNIFVDIEFCYSSNVLYYWTQFNNSTLNLKWIYDENKKKIAINSINNFIQSNLSKNNYFNNTNYQKKFICLKNIKKY